MKDTKENQEQQQEDKLNFQKLRKYISDGDCGVDCRKCTINLLYDEFVRIWQGREYKYNGE